MDNSVFSSFDCNVFESKKSMHINTTTNRTDLSFCARLVILTLQPTKRFVEFTVFGRFLLKSNSFLALKNRFCKIVNALAFITFWNTLERKKPLIFPFVLTWSVFSQTNRNSCVSGKPNWFIFRINSTLTRPFYFHNLTKIIRICRIPSLKYNANRSQHFVRIRRLGIHWMHKHPSLLK